MSARVDDGGSAGATGDVAEALAAVLASEPFQRSPRSRAFLSYVVEETIAGRSERLSERTVARAALGRGPDFDGSTDSVVRVTATRVRKALEAYYAGEGVNDVVRIVLPVGSYVPVVDRGGVPLREAGPLPGVGVLQPEVVGDERGHLVAASLPDALVWSARAACPVRGTLITRQRVHGCIGAIHADVTATRRRRVGLLRACARSLPGAPGGSLRGRCWGRDRELLRRARRPGRGRRRR